MMMTRVSLTDLILALDTTIEEDLGERQTVTGSQVGSQVLPAIPDSVLGTLKGAVPSN